MGTYGASKGMPRPVRRMFATQFAPPVAVGLVALMALIATTSFRFGTAKPVEKEVALLEHRSFSDVFVPKEYVPESMLSQPAYSSTLRLLRWGTEADCENKYNYACKFDFSVRCFVFGAFKNFEVAHSEQSLVDDVQVDDVVVIIDRTSDGIHGPPPLYSLLSKRRRGLIPASVRIGLMHTADEKKKTDFDWYTDADFVVRNYFKDGGPQWMPLDHQVLDTCDVQSCKCENLTLLPASERKYSFHFSGSLRRNRAELLRLLKANGTFANQGYIKAAETNFGGDGPHPKVEYLETMIQSKFVFAPCGNVMETHRMWEALSVGSIPVVEECESGWQRWWPFPETVFKSLPDSIEWVRSIEGDAGAVNALQSTILKEWESFVVKNVSVAAFNTIMGSRDEENRAAKWSRAGWERLVKRP